ncbi:DUF4233 domain-containing protein [Luethyella okanaganae]|uniref:DUF4233 domain-containing protein n=1 Tax=Luethyella okanaganae TaxID=69372 RepID=A0ABW1VET1_9MICO
MNDANDRERPDGSELPASPSAPRSVKRTLATIVLGFELVVVFLATLVIAFGPHPLVPAPVALLGGAVLCLVMVATIGLLRFEWAYAMGWAVQAIVVLTGLFNAVMFFVGALFAAMWVYCMISGSRIDRQKETA